LSLNKKIINMAINSQQIKEKARSLGFHQIGIATIVKDELAIERLQAWLALGYHADMEWMRNPKRGDVSSLMPEVRSLVCVALNYYTPHQPPSRKRLRQNLSLRMGERLSQGNA
jgi:epoxyqueuosine reductase